MTKKVLISIHPKWCDRIFGGEKTIEVRKTRAKLKPPFEVLVYEVERSDIENYYGCSIKYCGRGKVIGTFICDKIEEYEANERGWYIYPQDETCLLCDEIAHYGKGKTLYGWRITEPKLFDKPRELSEFGTICNKVGNQECGECPYLRVLGNSFPCDDCVDIWCGVNNIKPISRPPQSWQYIEEVLDE